MEVLVNGKPVEVAENATLADLMQQMQMPDKGVAAALNSQMVSRPEWVNSKLTAGDKVLIIKAACGG